ncbi:MAG: hypothetical protein BGO99_02370 [Nitrosospira sp. 56-18]|jgi:hypothetical protein|nr:MAG: hypothetical protein BGO99_02370 [Nitrosospira sp. 56-18]
MAQAGGGLSWKSLANLQSLGQFSEMLQRGSWIFTIFAYHPGSIFLVPEVAKNTVYWQQT